MLHGPCVMGVSLGMIWRSWLVIDEQTRCVPVSQIKGQTHAHWAATNDQNGGFEDGFHGCKTSNLVSRRHAPFFGRGAVDPLGSAGIFDKFGAC